MRLILETLQSLIALAKDHPNTAVLLATFVSSYVIQISPVKVYPFNWFKAGISKPIKWIGGEMNKELTVQFCQLREEIKELDVKFSEKTKTDDENRLEDLRWEILSFSDTVDKHFYKQEQFDHIFDSHEKYDNLIKKYNLTNGKVDRAMRKITEYYEVYKNDDNF